MNEYEQLLSEVQKEVSVIELSLKRFNSEGFYRNGKIYIEEALSVSRKREILAEEYGHFKTSTGTLLDLNHPSNRKQELRARKYSYEMLVSLDDLILCSGQGYTTAYDCAEFLGVTVDTLNEALRYYLARFGTTYFYKGKIISFYERGLMILDPAIQV